MMALLLTRHWRRSQVTNFLSVRHLSRKGGRDSSGKLTSEKRVDSTDDDPASTDKEKADAPAQGGSSRSTEKEKGNTIDWNVILDLIRKAPQVARESSKSKTRHKDGIELEVDPDDTGLFDYDKYYAKWEEKERRAQEKALWDRAHPRKDDGIHLEMNPDTGLFDFEKYYAECGKAEDALLELDPEREEYIRRVILKQSRRWNTFNPFSGCRRILCKPGGRRFGLIHSLPSLNDPRIDRLPYSIRILLESAIRNCHLGQDITKEDVEMIIDWESSSTNQVEIPFIPARVLLQDFTQVPANVILACIRDDLVSVNLVTGHSVEVDVANLELEFQRSKEICDSRRRVSKSCHNMLVVPPGSGPHQVNLEYLSSVVFNAEGLLYPDSVVGIDSHTTMINGLGVAGWGVGRIEAEAVMYGKPMNMILPCVVGFKLSGKLRNGITATDLALTITQILLEHGVVGKFVEFYGDGMRRLSLADRATIANMAPEYGASMGFFPVDNVTLQYLKLTGRSEETVAMIEAYLRENKMFVDYDEPQQERVYSSYLELNLDEVEPCISVPKKPHDRVALKEMKTDWHACLDSKVGYKGFLSIVEDAENKVAKFDFHGQPAKLKDGSVVIALITSCTNTSNLSVMLEAGLVAKKAYELGLQVKPWVKTSLTPGSGVVTEYLLQSGMQKYLNEQGFQIVGFGCTTGIGNSGDLDKSVASAISENDIRAAAVFSGNRNVEGRVPRVHPLTQTNLLVSPPLVVAYALAGTVDINFETEPIGTGKDGNNIYLSDVWPSTEEVAQVNEGILPYVIRKL